MLQESVWRPHILFVTMLSLVYHQPTCKKGEDVSESFMYFKVLLKIKIVTPILIISAGECEA